MTVFGRSVLPHVGIAPASPVVYNYTVFVVIGAVLLALSPVRKLRSGLWPWMPLIGWLCLGRLLWWSGTPEGLAGVVQMGQGILAFAVAASLGPWSPDDDPHPTLLVAILSLQVVAVGLGSLGILSLHASGPQSADLAGRAFGTLGHPDQLAKTLAIGLAVLLPFGVARRHRWMTTGGVVASLGGIALTQGRAAFAGAIALLIVWAVLQPRVGENRRRSAALLALLVVVVGLSATTFQERFAQDPSGGARGQLTTVALAAIRSRPWSGTGPNAYVTTVGRTDELTSTGVPVHNAFLLAAGEEGIPGAVFLFLPFVLLLARAWRRRKEDGSAGRQARACLGLAPVIVVLGWTGWGLLETSVFVFLCYVGGYFWGNLRGAPDDLVVDVADDAAVLA